MQGKWKNRESSDPYYDLIDDFDLIVSSFQTQYGIRLSRDLDGMKWDEFKDLVSGLNDKTPLGNIVAIRSESDKDVLKSFNRHQHRIRNEWRKRQAGELTQDQMKQLLDGLKQGFIELAGGSDKKES
ncbi:bacteriophage Gp15 family protein [Anaerovorax odorimutans]|uniref:Bacteriophage Gp15 family protein n=1 Tax=Anaerovorax odorimutans TaxID=109327 RepID=A0ABT1RTB4_9FIRM|nr:Gp15 family bacteriophage protein [Anaerovorax odorimutans]MCQ4638448.1 bacteriophage Gp15 family protein [Anaerovorax odorimutans]